MELYAESYLNFFFGEKVTAIIPAWQKAITDLPKKNCMTRGFKINVYLLNQDGSREILQKEKTAYKIIYAEFKKRWDPKK